MEPLNVKLTTYQDGFIFGPEKYKFLKAGWGTGKTLALILAAIEESETYPDNLGVIFRKEFEDLRDSTIKDFEKYTGMTVNSSREVKIGSSLIMFRHLEEMNNIQNMNLGWVGIEQGEELESDEYFFKLMGRMRRDNSSRKGYVIANAAGHNWIYNIKQNGLRDPKTGLRIDAHYEAATADNAENLPQDFIDSLEILRKSKPKIYKRFVENSDDEADLIDVIIQPSWVNAAKGRLIHSSLPVRRVVSIDVARGGSDKSVFYAIEDNKILGFETWETRNTMELVGRAQVFAKKFSTQSFAVDEIGVGGGVCDRLMELDYEVIPVNAAQREGVPEPYLNRRAEVLGYGAQLFEDGKVSILKDDMELSEQLSWTKWKPMKSNGTLQAESKDDVRETYHRSPDNADAFLNGLWALPKCSAADGDRTGFSPVGSVVGSDNRHIKRGASFRRYQQRVA